MGTQKSCQRRLTNLCSWHPRWLPHRLLKCWYGTLTSMIIIPLFFSYIKRKHSIAYSALPCDTGKKRYTTKRVRSSNSPWITPQLKKRLHERDIFKLKAIRSGNVDDWRKFKKSVVLQIVKLSLLKRFILTMRLNRIEETCVTLGES